MNHPSDLEMMKDPSLWVYPALPIKRHKDGKGNLMPGGIECALLWFDKKPTVIKGNLFAMPKTIEELRALPTIEYSSFEEILADGWVVD